MHVRRMENFDGRGFQVSGIRRLENLMADVFR